MEAFNVALIGCGRIGLSYEGDAKTRKFIKFITHAQIIKEHPAYRLFVAIDPKTTHQTQAKRYGFEHVYATIDDCDKKNEIDVLVIATPSDLRFTIMQNFPHVKAIICEKPLALSFEEITKIEQFCKAHHIVLHVNFWRRYDAAMQQLRDGELVARIGQLQQGFALYGGGLMNNGVHVIDIIDMLFGPICSMIKVVDGMKDNPHLNIDLPNDKSIYLAPINFEHYREIYIDLWGTNGRLVIGHEGLDVFCYPKVEHRALENHYEIGLDLVQRYTTGASAALYNLYEAVHADIRNKNYGFSSIHAKIVSFSRDKNDPFIS